MSFISDSTSPTLEFCPENQTVEAARGELVNVSWPQPEFSESLGFQLHVTSTFGTNTTHLSWGEHRVEYIARNTYNDKETACVFYIDVRRTLVFFGVLVELTFAVYNICLVNI